MPVLLVLLFVGLPLIEIAVVLQVGAAIGGWPTAALVVGFSVVGAALLRIEGRRAWQDFRLALSEGRWPGDEVAQAALIIVGGTLLVTPGFVTDLIGFVLLIGPSRRLVAGGVRRRVAASGAEGAGMGPMGGPASARGGPIGGAHGSAGP
ncbi:MAG: FxsA family protein, partial [Nitriliruptoraceae bacterium]|nr:FxsA family protein [Nitriliruptoraceae bacterium]